MYKDWEELMTDFHKKTSFSIIFAVKPVSRININRFNRILINIFIKGQIEGGTNEQLFPLKPLSD